jgi:hypothetical protein
MAKSKRVEFKTSEGIILRGDFYQAKDDKRPVVIMTPAACRSDEQMFVQHRRFLRSASRVSIP